MYLAIFGDVHGNLDAMYHFCLKWENINSKRITAILQTGDLGFSQMMKFLI